MPTVLYPPASARLLVLLGAAMGLSACVSSAPVIEVVPTVPESVNVPPPLPPPPAPVRAPDPEPPPAPLPTAPKGSIDARSLHPQIGVADWTLANGLRVVFKDLEGTGVALLAIDLDADSVLARTEASESLDAALAAAEAGLDPRRADLSLVVLVGSADPEAVEGWVGSRLASLRRWEVPYRLPIPAPPRRTTEIGWEDLRAALILRSLVEDRGETLTIGGGTVRVDAETADGMVRALRPAADAEVRAARDAVEVDAALWAETLAVLYAEPGPFRPARRPEAARDALGRLGAVPPAAVNALLARLRDATPR